MKSNKVLLKDIVIPAGTVFRSAPQKTERDSSFGEAVIGLTNDSFGTVTYSIEGDDEEKLKEWFAEVKG